MVDQVNSLYFSTMMQKYSEILKSDSAALKTVAVCQETLSHAGPDKLYNVSSLSEIMYTSNDKKLRILLMVNFAKYLFLQRLPSLENFKRLFFQRTYLFVICRQSILMKHTA